MEAVVSWLYGKTPSLTRPTALGWSDTEIAVEWECKEACLVDYYVVKVQENKDDEQESALWREACTTKETQALITRCKPDTMYSIKVEAVSHQEKVFSSQILREVQTRALAQVGPSYEQYLLDALVAAEGCYMDDPGVFLSSTTRAHTLEVVYNIQRDITIYRRVTSKKEDILFIAFRGDPRPFVSNDPQCDIFKRFLTSKNREKPIKGAYFVGFDNGGTDAVRAFIEYMNFCTAMCLNSDEYTPSVWTECITFGAPLTLTLDTPHGMLYKHLIHHVVTHRDPVVLSVFADSEWKKRFVEESMHCRCRGKYLMGVPKTDGIWGCKEGIITSMLGELSTNVARASQSTNHSGNVLGSVKVLNRDVPFNLATVSEPPLKANDLLNHMTTYYDEAVLPIGKNTHDGALTPIVDRERTFMCVVGDTVEVSIGGQNLQYITKIIIRSRSGEKEEVVEPALSEVQMHKVTALTDIVKLGLIECDPTLSLELQTERFGYVVFDNVQKMPKYKISYVPKWAARFGEMKELGTFLSTAIKVSLLTDNNGAFTNPELHKHIADLEPLRGVFERHNSNLMYLSRFTTKKSSPCTPTNMSVLQNDADDQKIRRMLEEFSKGEIDEEIAGKEMFQVASGMIDALEPALFVSLASESTAAGWMTFSAKVAIALGGICVVLNPAAVAIAAGLGETAAVLGSTVVPHASDVYCHTARISHSYDAKVSFVATMLYNGKPIPSSLFCKEHLIHAKLNEVMTIDEDNLHNMKKFIDELLRRWDKLFDNTIMHKCAERETFACLIWSIYHMFEIRRIMMETFLVQVFGVSNVGKTTVVQNVFGVSSVNAGCMADETTTKKSGHLVLGCKPLVIADNPGMQDTRGRGEVVIDSAAYYLFIASWDSGLRSSALVSRLAMIQALGKPFKLLITKADTMVSNRSVNTKEKNRIWLNGHLDDLNKSLAECQKYIADPAASINDDLKMCIDNLRELLDDTLKPDVSNIGVEAVAIDDCIICSVHEIDDPERNALRAKDCKELGVELVGGVRSVLHDAWKEIYAFDCPLADLVDPQAPEVIPDTGLQSQHSQDIPV